MQAAPLSDTFVVLDAALRCTPVPVTPGLYRALDEDFSGFAGCALVAEHRFERDWDTWEIHPAGDELLYLLEGKATLHLLVDGEERRVEFDRPGSALVVPRNTWHTAKVAGPCRILFVTPGEGTRNAADPRAAA